MPNTPATWLDAVTVNTTTAGTRSDSRVTVLSNGNILISWTATTQAPGEPAASNIVGQILDPLGNPVSGEFVINVGSEGHLASNSDIQATADGGFFAVFERNQVNLEDVLIIRFDASGAPSPTGNLFFDVTRSGDSGVDPSGFDPQVAVASETSGLAVWRQTTVTGESILRGFVFDASSPASAGNDDPNLLDLATDAGIQGEPAVVAMANGNYAVAVSAIIDGDSQIRLYIVDAEGNVTNARDAVNGATGVEDLAPSLTPLGDRFVMTWSADGVIQVQLFRNTGQTIGAQNSIPDLTVGEDDQPVVQDLGDNGYAVVVMDSATGTIHVQRFDVTGATVGARGVFHTGDASWPPDLALLPDGRLVVTFIDAAGQVAMEILDTRNATGEAGTMITGTIGDDDITYEGPATFVGGGAGDDTINATPTDPFRTFDGGDGDDRINVGSVVNGDIYLGGRGADTIDWSGSGESGLVIDLAAGIATVDSFTEVMLGFEHAVGTQGDDRIIGDDGDNVLEGLGGADLIEGGAGDDVLRGGDGDDTLDGGDGDDMLLGGKGADTFIGGAGNDTVDYSDASTGVYADLLFNNTLGGAVGDSSSGIENLTGSAFDDTLLGGDVDNVLRGGDGNDVLIGDGGDDILHGEAGDDQLFGGNGNDTLLGGDGDDYMEDRAGQNLFDGGDGFDIASYDEIDEDLLVDLSTGFNSRGDTLVSIEGVMGGEGNDELIGDDGENALYGSHGDDWITGGGGADLLDGGQGDFDTLDYRTSSGGVTVSLLDDTASGGDAEGDIISGFENVFGSAFADTLTGDAGDNYVEGFSGADLLNGGGGVDTLSYFSSSGGVTVSLLDNTASRGDAEGDVFSGFENILGSSFDDILTGDAGANAIRGWAGNDVLYGGAGADTLDGGTGDDILRGGAGMDVLIGGSGIDTADYGAAAGGVTASLATGGASNDGDGSTDGFSGIENLTGSAFNDVLTGNGANNRLVGGAGNDTLDGLNGDDVLVGGAGVDVLNGGAGVDTVDYSGAASAVRAQLNTNASTNDGDGGTDTFSGIENLTGSAFNDILIGDAGGNVLRGGLGSDTLIGLAGNDVLWGGAGAANVLQGGTGDDLYVLEAYDSITEFAGEGIDTVDARINTYVLANHVENLLFGGTGNFNGTGNALNNVITGGAGNDVLRGGAGSDVLNGGAGIDTADYTLAAAGVVARLDRQEASNDGDGSSDAFSSIENLIGSNFNDLLIGNGGDNVLMGGVGVDILLGLAGDDILFGGPAGGNNQLQGGTGNDWYVLDAFDTCVEFEGEGIDTVEARIGSYVLRDNIENLIYTGGTKFVGTGNGLDNEITGGANNDILRGMGGNDIIRGGLGTDEVQFRGLAADYTITAEGAGWRIVDAVGGRDGSTYVESIEVLRFVNNATVSLSYPPPAPAPGETAAKTTADAFVSPLADDDAFVLPAMPDDQPLVLPGLEMAKFADDALVLPGVDAPVHLFEDLLAHLGSADDWMITLHSGGDLSGELVNPSHHDWM